MCCPFPVRAQTSIFGDTRNSSITLRKCSKKACFALPFACGEFPIGGRAETAGSFTQQDLLSACGVPGAILGAGDTAVTKAEPLPMWSFYPSRETGNKLLNK